MSPRALSATRRLPRTLAALLCLGLFPPVAMPQPRPPAPSTPALGPLPFANGESLVYELSWLGIVGGTAELHVDPPAEHDGTLAYRITSRARSNDFFTKIYPVDDRTESLVDAHRFRSLSFQKHLSEGGKHRDALVR